MDCIRCYEIDWKSRIIAVTDSSYVILDKLAGTTVGGTTDNIEESCATFSSRALDLEEPQKQHIRLLTAQKAVLSLLKLFCFILLLI
ncbi:hypothetical protein Bca4012_062730 [Brassica carinata]